MNILLLGNGARENVIAETIARSPQKPKLFSYMKANNPGISGLSQDVQIGNYDNINEIINFAKSNAVDFAVIGPEDPLQKGVVDELEKEGIPCVGPKKELARLETSKSFTRLLLKKYNISGNPRFQVFESVDGIKEFLEELDQIVIKPDGLTAGKGVKVQGDHFQTKQEALKYCEEVLKTHPAVVVEEKLDGEEFSLQTLTDGKHCVHFPVVQDHKRAFNDDKGPNTGGMGSYSYPNHSLPFLSDDDVNQAKKITEKVCKALNEETGLEYKGVMYGGFIAVKDGVRLIEYNARFGDPEAMNVLPLLKTDFIALCQAVIVGELNKMKIEFEKKATVCKYVVPSGYPINPVKNEKISLREVPKNIKLYYASVNKKPDGLYMSTSRALAFVGIDYDIENAEVLAENAVSSVEGNIFHRDDIGTNDLIQKRIGHMKKLRS